ncbi:hypothetical protein K8R61_02595, partial [bacterium]|nr:hypothetical protein [bacterium]
KKKKKNKKEMQIKIIKSKYINIGFLELVELSNDSNKIIGYSARIAHKQKNVIGGGVGQLEEIKLGNNKDKALKFFNDQT